MKNWQKIALRILLFTVGALSGHVAGAAIGTVHRLLSTLAGLGVTGLGFHLMEEKEKDGKKYWTGVFSLGFAGGLLTSPIIEVKPSVVQQMSGLGAIGTDAKEGAKIALKNIGLKLYLDKTPLAKYIPGMAGLGDTPTLSEAEAQRIIDDMIRAKESVDGLDGDLFDDYLNGSIAEDFGVGDIYEEIGDLGITPGNNRPKIQTGSGELDELFAGMTGIGMESLLLD